MSGMTENILEETALAWLGDMGYEILHGPDLAPDGVAPERENYGQVVLFARLRQALERVNPDVPGEGIDEAVRQIQNLTSPDLLTTNRAFHRVLTDGIPVEVSSSSPVGRGGGEGFVYATEHKIVWFLDLEDVANNDLMALNQFTVTTEKSLPSTSGRGAGGEGGRQATRRADVVVFVNGLPLAVLELKNPGSENATIRHAYNQLQTYKADVPSLFSANEVLVISDGLQARLGTLSSGWDRFMRWRAPSPPTPLPGGEGSVGALGNDALAGGVPQLEELITSLFEPRRLLDYVLNFVVFEDDGAKVIKKAAAYHQYWAVNRALSCTFSACGIDPDDTRLIGRFPALDEDPGLAIAEGDPVYGKGTPHFGGRRIGVVWHTQGSGKSLSMAFYAGKVIRHPDMGNPTLVVITDRNDLDEQLFTTFANCRELMRQAPVQAASRAHLKDLLKVASGGVIFTTIQKFMPSAPSPQPSPSGRGSHAESDGYLPSTPGRGAGGEGALSSRTNIVVIADEAHRSQYGFIDGFARKLHEALPRASFIGFTGTSVEQDDRSTPAVFGDYIDKYRTLDLAEDSVVPNCLRAEGPAQSQPRARSPGYRIHPQLRAEGPHQWISLRKRILERTFSPQLLAYLYPRVADPGLKMGRAVGPRTKQIRHKCTTSIFRNGTAVRGQTTPRDQEF